VNQGKKCMPIKIPQFEEKRWKFTTKITSLQENIYKGLKRQKKIGIDSELSHFPRTFLKF
jgi:hypothetical protein